MSDLQEPPLISKCGSLEVSFVYNVAKQRMNVTVHRAQDIPSKERGGANSTQVRLILLPERKTKHKTKIKQGESPIFNETFAIKVPKGERKHPRRSILRTINSARTLPVNLKITLKYNFPTSTLNRFMLKYAHCTMYVIIRAN